MGNACSGNGADGGNYAFVFIKSHAQVAAVRDLVSKTFADKKIRILQEGEIKGEVIDQKMLIDNHYYAIASKATILPPDQLPVPADKFKAKFGLEWQDALKSGKVYNAKQACEKFGVTADELSAEWVKGKAMCEKFGGGFYCAKIQLKGEEIYVFNAFFMTMRSKFTAPGSSIYYYSVTWNPADLSWADFRGKVLGPTDPANAPVGSIRKTILDKYQELGLKSLPDGTDNGVHASASPFEGMAERLNWLGTPVSADPFGAKCLRIGMSDARIKEWAKDARVTGEDGNPTSIFDALEDINVQECIDKLEKINMANK